MTKPRPMISRRHTLCGGLAAAAAISFATPTLAKGIASPATPEDERLMRIALEEAALGDFPFGAVIVRDGSVLAKGRNLGIQQKDPTAHGEMVAVRNFLAAYGPEPLKGTTLYTSGESCAMCMGAILWCGISRLVFGASIAELATKMGQIMLTDQQIAAEAPFATIEITGGVLAKEALALFK